MFYIACVYKLIDPSDADYSNWVTTLTKSVSSGGFGVSTLNEKPINIYTIENNKFYNDYQAAYNICKIYNQSVARRDNTGYILGYVVCNTETPQFNIYGMNFVGTKMANTEFELQPFEVAQMAVNFYNSNVILDSRNTQIPSDNKVVTYTYFMPRGGQ